MMQFTAPIPARSFGLCSDRSILGFAAGANCPHGVIPELDPGHVFDPVTFESIRMWWEAADTSAPLYISGPTGCGKTSTVLQFLARVHAPAVVYTCRRRMDKQDLVGAWGVDSATGNFRWYDGPATLAWRHGLVLVINEFTTAPAEVWVSANDLLEGASLVNERTGEVIPRHPNTRVIITDNCPAGCAGDGEGIYVARERQDASVADRFWHVAVGYMGREREAMALLAACSDCSGAIGAELLDRIVGRALDFAAATRDLAARPPAQDSWGAPREHAVSTRVLIRFTRTLIGLIEARMALGGAAAGRVLSDPVGRALDLAIANGCHETVRHTLHQLAQFCFATLTIPAKGSQERRPAP
jgi:cobaltochelatase CobS